MNRPRWLVLCIGNPSRGDDALGPLFAERLAHWAEGRTLPVDLTILSEYQCQIEHVLDLAAADLALFVDAGTGGDIALTPLAPRRDHSLTSHSLSPACLLALAAELGYGPHEAWLLVMRGEMFELGAPLGAAAETRLAAALRQVCAGLQAVSLSSAASTASPIPVVESLVMPGCMMSPVRLPLSSTDLIDISSKSDSLPRSKL
jgi:hydrogenase maturation protease